MHTHSEWPSPAGLLCGIVAVASAQCIVVGYYYWLLRTRGCADAFWAGCRGHLVRPEGFLLVCAYLCATWMLGLLPPSYYRWEGGLSPGHLCLQLVVHDLLQTLVHMGQHRLCPRIYKLSHKQHHRFVQPTLFDAFDGSVTDTACMILLPLLATAHAVHCNAWSYMAFGATLSSWLTLIHSEIDHPWDPAFRKIGLGTAGDHRAHHRRSVCNYGHLFMWWDIVAGTYMPPDGAL